MTQERFRLWQPKGVLAYNPETVAVHWSLSSGLRVLVSEHPSEVPVLSVIFSFARAFQCMDEGYRLANLPNGKGLIWQVEESMYTAAFRKAAASTMDNFPIIHWFVAGANQCVDALSEREPKIGPP